MSLCLNLVSNLNLAPGVPHFTLQISIWFESINLISFRVNVRSYFMVVYKYSAINGNL